MSTDDHIQNVYLGVVVRVYHYPRKVPRPAMTTFSGYQVEIRLLPRSGTFVLLPQWRRFCSS